MVEAPSHLRDHADELTLTLLAALLGLGELAFIAWLLVKGVRIPRAGRRFPHEGDRPRRVRPTDVGATVRL
jgi:hypothetical protein